MLQLGLLQLLWCLCQLLKMDWRPKEMFLARYDPAQLIKMAGDASAYGIGVVASHIFPEGTESPHYFEYRTLFTSECNYA